MLSLRPQLETLKAYVPGKLVSGCVKLASNGNPLGPSPLALKAFLETSQSLHLYPDGSSRNLSQSLASYYNLEPDHFFLGNGSDEVILFATGAFLRPGETVLVADHTFSEYSFSATLFGDLTVKVPLVKGYFDLAGFLRAIDDKTRIVFLCSPNNPTGTIIPEEQLLDFLNKVPSSVLVILDQAYAEFVEDPSYGDFRVLLEKYPNLLVTRTFSKIYGLAGLRVGYGMGSKTLIDMIKKIKPPFNINTPAQAAASAALTDSAFREKTQKLIKAGREFWKKKLEQTDLVFLPTQANFICLDTRRPAQEVYNKVLEGGFTIRALNSFDLPTCVRITIGSAEQNERCFDALMKALAVIPAHSLASYL